MAISSCLSPGFMFTVNAAYVPKLHAELNFPEVWLLKFITFLFDEETKPDLPVILMLMADLAFWVI